MPDSVDRPDDPATGTGNVDVEAARGSALTDPGSADLAVSVVGRFFRLAPRLMDIQDRGAREYGLGFARGRVLWALHASGPVLMRALSQALGISTRTVTGLVDALEADGWVTRTPHPEDRRATIISLTQAANIALARLREFYAALSHDLLGDIPEEDLETTRRVMTTLEDRLDAVVAEKSAAFGPPVGSGPPG
jgi:DNA-binding MarR family transcriptional regulator